MAVTVSIIVCTYNRCDSLRETLEAISKQQPGDDIALDIIVVDNNSSDNTRSVVEAFAPQSPFPIRYIFEQKQGLSNARNTGVLQSTSEIICFTDDDVLPASNWVRVLATALVDDRASVAGSKILPGWPIATVPKWLTRDLWPYLALLDYGNEDKALQDKYLWGASIAFKRETLLQHGLFNPELGRTKGKLFGGEEIELMNSIRQSGGIILYLADSQVIHKIEDYRVTKHYFRKWVFDQGELEARLYDNPMEKKLLNVPRYQ